MGVRSQPRSVQRTSLMGRLQEALTRRLVALPWVGPRLDPHRLRVTFGAALSFLFRGMDAVFGLLFNLALARAFGPSGSGIFFLALGTASVAMLFGKMGLGSVLMRLVAARSSTGDWGRTSGTYRKAIGLAAGFSALSSLALCLTASLLAEKIFHKPELTEPIRWAALTVVPGVLLELHGEALRGLGRIRDSLWVGSLSVPTLSLLGLLALVHIIPDIRAALIGQVIAVSLTALAGAWLWRSALSSRPRKVVPVPASKLLENSSPLFWIGFVGLFSSWASTFALGAWTTKEEVGIYGIALRMASLVHWILFAVNQVANPMFAAFFHKRDRAALRRTVAFSAKAMTLIALPPTLLLAVFPGFFLGLFGSDFREGALILVILALGNFIKVACGTSTPLLLMSGHERSFRNRAMAVSGLAIVLNLTLVPLWGLLGAAVATGTCVALSNLISVWLVWRKLGIWTLPYLWRPPR